MAPQQQFKQKHFFYSLVLHVILLTVLVISYDFSSQMPVVENSNKTDIINAMVVDSAPKSLSKKIPLPTPQPVKADPIKAQPKPAPAPPKLLPPKPVAVQPTKEAIIIPDKKQKNVKENLIQKQLLADLKKQTDTKKKTQQVKSLESDFAKDMAALKAKSIEQQMAQEEKERLEGERAAQMHGIVDKYKALILQTISQHWLVPHSADKNLSAQLLIRVAPGGMVLDVQVIKSSGDEALDRSARAAVFKASPLPVPTNSNEFEPFRHFVLKVKPENVLVKDNWMS